MIFINQMFKMSNKTIFKILMKQEIKLETKWDYKIKIVCDCFINYLFKNTII